MCEQEIIVAAVAVGEQRGLARRPRVPVNPNPPPPGGGLLEDKRLTVRQVFGAENAIREKSELTARAARHGDTMNLNGISKAGPDEDFAARWMPAEEGRGTGLTIPRRFFGTLQRDGRNVFDDQIVARLDDIRGRLRQPRPTQRDQEQNHDGTGRSNHFYHRQVSSKPLTICAAARDPLGAAIRPDRPRWAAPALRHVRAHNSPGRRCRLRSWPTPPPGPAGWAGTA